MIQKPNAMLPSGLSHARNGPVILLGASLLEVAGMLHHPSVHAPTVVQAVEQIARLSILSAVIHGALISLVLLIFYGFLEFVMREGFERPLIRAGVIAYGCGVLVMIGAGLVSGFIITNLVSLVPHATQVDLQINLQLLLLCRVLNQACADFAVVAMSVGIACWSVHLCARSGLPRAVGILGCLVAVACSFGLIFSQIRLDVPGMTEVIIVQAAWNCAVAVLMLRSGRHIQDSTVTSIRPTSGV